MVTTLLAPGVPHDYYERIRAFEDSHWWYRGIRAIGDALLAGRVPAGARVLDAGCGTGGFLVHAQEAWAPARLAGADLAEAAIASARERIPQAELQVAPLSALPFEDASFDLVVTQDVLQHVHEDELDASVSELRRVLAPNGTLLVRTNGSRRLRRERDDRAVQKALDAAEEAARGTDNLLYPMKEALRAGATLGEVSDALREVFGVHTPRG
jgi:SAM-dependent methyltransferase